MVVFFDSTAQYVSGLLNNSTVIYNKAVGCLANGQKGEVHMINTSRIGLLSQPVRQQMRETFKKYLEDLRKDCMDDTRSNTLQYRVENMFFSLEKNGIWVSTADTITQDLCELIKAL